jgi:hypothetical protein
MLGKSTSLMAAAAVLTACANSASITRTSAAYNKAMADVRNEQMLLNIIRAAAREPLQFSAMGEINTTFDRSATLNSNFNNFIAGGANAVTQALGLTGGNKPTTKLTPLLNKEFIGGILRPTAPETLRQFMDLGWDPEFMLPLLVARYRCPKEKNFTYISGTGGELQQKLDALSEAASSAQWATVETAGKPVTLLVPDEKALEMVRSGVAKGYKVDSVSPSPTAGKSIVKLIGPGSSSTTFQINLCGAPTAMAFTGEASAESPAAVVEPDAEAGQIVLRSVEGILYFLGASIRDCYLDGKSPDNCSLSYVARKPDKPDPKELNRKVCARSGENSGTSIEKRRRYLLRVAAGPSRPPTAAVGARFYGTSYWVSRLDQNDCDRTVKTFSFLNQLIALQTDPSAIGTTQTVLPVGT